MLTIAIKYPMNDIICNNKELTLASLYYFI